MKLLLLATLTTISLTLSPAIFADCSSDGGSCGSSSCDPYMTTCQCTDPSCGTSYYNGNCLSASDCCEAFGNVGGR